MLRAIVELWISDLTTVDPASLDRARAEFRDRTGAFEVGERWYEERITFFFEWFICDRGGAQRWLALNPDASQEDRERVRACTSTARSLYTATEVNAESVLLADRLGGGRFEIERAGAAAGLAVGETFDGRLVVLNAHDGRLPGLADGIIFHPRQTSEALDQLLSDLGEWQGDRGEILDGLLRMRMRLDRFASIRPRHIYLLRALHQRDINSASWANKQA